MVGQNLQDHVIIPVTIYGHGPTQPDTATTNFDAIRYLFNRTGYLAQNSFSDILAFYSTAKNASYPEFQSHLSIFWKNFTKTRNAFSNQFRYNATIADYVVKLNKKYIMYDFLFNLLHPYSTGHIYLNSNDPNDHPLIYPNYFKDPRDLDAAAAGIRALTKIVGTKFFKSIGAFVGRMKWPPCDKLELDSTEYWKCVCLNMPLTCYHPVGTCKMGPDSKTSVVDSELRVHAVQNIRVIDASIMPTITSGNTNGPATMIGERGADLVKRTYSNVK
ncbi:Glucose dehydrogenase [Operophtera brumata]|uniref:Glucose dehydrogenase n=1 Tax=Operophtera brumata TaxID=104452 RepID=A0A0L7KLE9_OPEBR|nr:Glucose dehydrogenase [Operophtera brumata]